MNKILPLALVLAAGLAACDSGDDSATMPAEGDTTIVEGDTVVEDEATPSSTRTPPGATVDADGVNVDINGDGVGVDATVPVNDDVQVRVDTAN